MLKMISNELLLLNIELQFVDADERLRRKFSTIWHEIRQLELENIDRQRVPIKTLLRIESPESSAKTSLKHD